ncbi:MAG: hypothetical protein LBH95_06570 [Oscillospiraceae bacterium]|nr:hypothetical protein [Oscillospiraceae bacterium]
MDKVRPMPLLLIEDEVSDCARFKECADRRTDVIFVGMTDSCEEGIKLVQSRLPEGVILDLQLVKGAGSGLRFLEILNEAELAFRPIVIITTSNQSNLVYDRIEGLGADWIFCKKQKGYSESFVVETMLSLRESLHTKQRGGASKERQLIESPEERDTRIYNRIDTELNLVGVRVRFKGHEYLRDAIYLKLNDEKGAGSAIEQVAQKHHHAYPTVSKVMQTAINNAWDNASIGELQTYYTAHISSKTGVPSATDFIYFYADKIRKTM